MTKPNTGQAVPRTHILDVWGDLACFSRADLKVERFSYPVATPSAARSIFDAVFWKPQFRWAVDRIEVLSHPKYIALRRNEVKDRVPPERTLRQWMAGTREPEPIIADGDRDSLGTDQKGRTQRQTMALKDVRYRLFAHIVPWPGHEAELPKYNDMFRRRAARGQCAWQPSLGCREFVAFFRLADQDDPPPPAPVDIDVGWMVYDTFDLSRPGSSHDQASISLFKAVVRQGRLDVPPYESPDVRKAVEVT